MEFAGVNTGYLLSESLSIVRCHLPHIFLTAFSCLSGQPERFQHPNLFDFVPLSSSSEDLSELFLDLFGSGFDVHVVIYLFIYFFPLLHLESLCSRVSGFLLSWPGKGI